MAQRSTSFDPVATQRSRSATLSRAHRLKRQFSHGAGTFLGISRKDNTTSEDSWLQRRAAFHGSSVFTGRTVSQKCKDKLECQEQAAYAGTMPHSVRDPLHKPGTAYRPVGTAAYDEPDLQRTVSQSSAVTRSTIGGRRRTLRKKESVAQIALGGLSHALGFKQPERMRTRMYSVQSRSLPPPSLSELPEADQVLLPAGITIPATAETIIEESDSLDDEVFFDNRNHATSALDLRDVMPFVSQTVTDKGAAGEPLDELPFPRNRWREGAERPREVPGTPGVAHDVVDFAFPHRILDKVTNTVLDKPEKRRLGEGIFGRIFQRSMREPDTGLSVKDQLDNLESDYRPYFTYWVTFVQLVVLIVSIAVFGFAPIGFGKSVESQDVLVTQLYPKRIGFEEPENFWIGPRQVDLIHLGAKYAPCMRKDPNIDELHEKMRIREGKTACCIYGDNSGCYQSLENECSTRAKWHTWTIEKNSKGGRKSGSVCGQDPEWCRNPVGSVTPTSDWPDDITKWPVCADKDTRRDSSNDPHMNCKVMSRPCCIGVKGECKMLSEDHCKAKHGYFHPNATLCSQVKCLGKVCGLINFLNDDYPDQFYRLWLSLFLHAGVFHLLLTVVFQFLILRDMEKLAGAVRVAIIYLGAGLGGNLASAIFLPYHVEVGPAGAQFGILATLWVEVIQSWQLINRPVVALLKVAAFTLALFILGLLPWIDNYAHIFGFIFGLLLSFSLLPYITFGSEDKRRKLIIKIVCIVLVILLYVVLFIVFYVTPIRECKGCRYLNCVPFKADFCENMGVEVEATETKFEWEEQDI